MTRAYVIAEIGSNHGGDLDVMLGAIDDCADLDFDAVKFQWTSDARRMASRRGRAAADGYADLYERYLQWPPDWHEKLRARCTDAQVDYMCTAYLPDDVDALARFVARGKVAAFEAADGEMREAYARHRGAVVYVSAGMMDSAGVRATARAWQKATPFARIMHCVSAYPTPIEESQLGALRSGIYFGYSDHTPPEETWTGALAVAAMPPLREVAIEAHVQVRDQDASLPDVVVSMDARQAADYVRRIRRAEAALSTGGVRRVQESERAMLAYRVR